MPKHCATSPEQLVQQLAVVVEVKHREQLGLDRTPLVEREQQLGSDRTLLGLAREQQLDSSKGLQVGS